MFEIFEYVTKNLDAPAAAGALIEKIESACNRLTVFPFSGVIPRDATLAKKGYRMLVVGNFLVFYTADEQAVKIMRVVYGRRNYQSLL
ncbi:MAG: type II toxin-antitoxin system RelE/ParE family toxin [Firmicutes bacterium]|nr:type II toxin-antitoxin system RelE/ParE family toxin [Bacillota bacterium]